MQFGMISDFSKDKIGNQDSYSKQFECIVLILGSYHLAQ